VGRLLRFVAWIWLACLPLICQTPVDLGNGFKPWGSYDGGNLDSVSLESGNLLLHAPVIPKYPQRGGSLTPEIRLYLSSHNWISTCMGKDPTTGTPSGCSWQFGTTGVWFEFLGGTSVQRVVESTSDPQFGVSYSLGGGYALSTWDGASHQLYDLSNGALSNFVTMDGSGYQLVTSNPDQYGIPETGIVTDRKGEQHVSTFGGGRCTFPVYFVPRPSGNFALVYDNWETGPTVCTEHSLLQQIIDPNGNALSLQAPLVSPNPPQDTMGRPSWPLQGGTPSDASGCINTLPFAQSIVYTFPSENGVQNRIKICMGTPTLQTSFGLPGVIEFQNTPVAAQPPNPITTSIILPDGTSWAFSYDTYGNVTTIQLPTGGSISYVWSTIIPGITNPCIMKTPGAGPMPAARVIGQRTLVDNNGNSSTWIYHWGSLATDGSVTNWVTDPNGNDTVHVFKNVASTQCFGSSPGASLHETQTKYFRGLKDGGALLRQVDTGYGRAIISSIPSGLAAEANVFPTDIQTTVYPSGKVNLIHKDYDFAYGANAPSAGTVTTEKVYDWGIGSPGPLLRETDTTYQWQKNSNYLTTPHILDLPASVVVKDGGGCAVAQTDYNYDEVEPTGSGISTQHLILPVGTARGNQTSVTRRLFSACNPASFTPVTTQTKWLDTGEPLQTTDAGGHKTAFSYDPVYIGTYPTQTCSPATAGGAVTHCVSGTYDFNTGLLTNFSGENATQPASGTTPGDVNHTFSYSYDPPTLRLLTALAPPDPGNSGVQAQTKLVYSPPGQLPLTEQVQRPVTPAYIDYVTTTFDGLGRPFQTDHAMPGGGSSTVITTYDDLHHKVSITNPFFSTADPTYGSITAQSDALARAITVTEQDGSVKSVSYDVVAPNSLGNCTISTDEAGKQRQSCSDALGRLVEVDEPGNPSSGTLAGGSLSVNGTLQSVLVGGSPAQSAVGSITISGLEPSRFYPSQKYCAAFDLQGRCVDIEFTVATTVYDSGTVSTYVNGQLFSYTYGANDSVTSIANGLAASIRANSPTTDYSSIVVNTAVTPPVATLSLIARTPGVAGNNITLATSPTSYDTTDFTTASFNPGVPAATLSGGVAAVSPTPSYDTGNVTLVVGGYSATATYGNAAGQDNTSAAVAADLVSKINAQLPVISPPFSVTTSGATVNVNFKVPGTQSAALTSSTTQTGSFSAPSFAGCSIAGNPQACNVSLGGTNPDPSGMASPYVTRYQYDALSNLLCVEQHGNATGTGCASPATSDATSPWRVRRFSYDSLSRVLTAHNPESGNITYAYDADGNLLQKTSPAPNTPNTSVATQTISYCYDELHRVTGKAYSAQSCPLVFPVVTYAYDSGPNAKGKLTSLTDQAGSASYSYDPLGRMISETRVINGVSKSMSYDYNLDGSIKTIYYPSGAAVTYTPDAAGRVLSAVDAGNNINYVTGASYQADGQLTTFVSGSGAAFAGITNTFSYNKRLQPINMSASAPSQTVFSIGYDFHVGNGTSGTNNGNVWGITNYKDNTRNQSFTYDLLNRLTSAQNAGTDCTKKTLNPNQTEYWGNSYSYDPWGNLLAKSVTKCSAETLSVPALANNQLSGYGYDAAGNMTADPTDGGLALSYDQENRISAAGGYVYTYDADGNRVMKATPPPPATPASGTIYWYMTPGIVAESDLSGTLKSEYVFFEGERVARRDLAAPSGVFYYFSDHLKTASVITDSLGNIKSESDYYPWGGELQFVSNNSNHYKFTGKERDETGLDYFGARYYSNGLARFITSDWAAKAAAVPYAEFADPQSLNLYTYVRNVPTSKADADGHDALGDIIYTGIAIAASKVGPYVGAASDALGNIAHFATSEWQPHALPLPSPAGCTCASTPQQNDNTKNNNNSQSSNTAEQGRDAQGKFTSKQPGQSAPGAAAEKQGLDSVGAVKNTEKLNGTVRDGTIPETGQHVEVKSGESINNTEQLQKMGQAAMDATGQPLKVITTNPNAKVSGPAKLNQNLDIQPLKRK
jgi:RHS repeat-associated protein